ncbi:MAG: helix-turn-helix domain-containing protein, partial [Bacilli bacterium]|nr:helix-turn-helix domain-containing protein [Bacilli bacterium]
MKYITVEEASKKFELSARSIRNYCAQGRIPGAVLSGKTWLIPEEAKKPERINSKADDSSIENNKYGN